MRCRILNISGAIKTFRHIFEQNFVDIIHPNPNPDVCLVQNLDFMLTFNVGDTILEMLLNSVGIFLHRISGEYVRTCLCQC
jgi:hypothetical protein